MSKSELYRLAIQRGGSMKDAFETWWYSLESRKQNQLSIIDSREIWQACAKIKEGEIAALKEQYTSLQTSYAAVWESRDHGIAEYEECSVEDNRVINHLTKEIEQLNARVAMLSEAIKEIWYSNSTPIAETKYQEVINATEADVTKFLNGVRAARDAEWMAEPFGYYWQTITQDEEGIIFGPEVKDYPEWQLKEMQPLYAQPKEVK